MAAFKFVSQQEIAPMQKMIAKVLPMHSLSLRSSAPFIDYNGLQLTVFGPSGPHKASNKKAPRLGIAMRDGL